MPTKYWIVWHNGQRWVYGRSYSTEVEARAEVEKLKREREFFRNVATPYVTAVCPPAGVG